MAAEFLAPLASEGRTVVTVLRTDQYSGLESFREVGEFVPLRVDRQGKVTREVALARFSLLLASASWAGTGPAGRGFPAICATRSPMTSNQRTRTDRASGMRNPMAPMSTG